MTDSCAEYSSTIFGCAGVFTQAPPQAVLRLPTQPSRLDRDGRSPQAVIRRSSGNVSLEWQAAFLFGYNANVELPSLPPDLSFPRLGNTGDEISFAFSAKSSALGPHIVARWGWDEDFQREVHDKRYAFKTFFAIERAGEKIGTISIDIFASHIQLGEFYLFSDFQRRGIGTAVLQHFVEFADDRKLPVRLEYLRWNPVGRLYIRFGFLELTRSETHCFMERPLAFRKVAPGR